MYKQINKYGDFLMCILFYFSFLRLHVCAFAIHSMVHCGSVFEPGASGLPYYFTPPVCVPAVLGALSVWRQNQKKEIRVCVCHSFHGSLRECLRARRFLITAPPSVCVPDVSGALGRGFQTKTYKYVYIFQLC